MSHKIIMILFGLVLILGIFTFIVFVAKTLTDEEAQRCGFRENTMDCKCKYNYGEEWKGDREDTGLFSHKSTCINTRTLEKKDYLDFFKKVN